MLQVRVTDSDKANRVLAFLRKVFVMIWGGFSGGAIKSLSSIVVSSMASEAAGLTVEALGGKGKETRSEVIEESKAVQSSVPGKPTKCLRGTT